MSLVLAVAVLMSVPQGGGKFGRWIDDLGHESPAVREEASLRLRAAGRAAWPELEAAGTHHPDLETRSRCRDLNGVEPWACSTVRSAAAMLSSICPCSR